MKISSFQPMNVYNSPSVSRQSGAAPQQARKPENDAQAARQAETDNAEIMSREEKEYFASLYPEESKTIISYSTYSKNGATKPYSVGSLIDKKS